MHECIPYGQKMTFGAAPPLINEGAEGAVSASAKNSDILLHFLKILVQYKWYTFGCAGCYLNNGRRLALFSEGDEKPSVYIEICPDRNSCNGGYAILTAYEIIALVVAILGILVSLIGIVVKLIIELINAKK